MECLGVVAVIHTVKDFVKIYKTQSDFLLEFCTSVALKLLGMLRNYGHISRLEWMAQVAMGSYWAAIVVEGESSIDNNSETPANFFVSTLQKKESVNHILIFLTLKALW